MRKSVIYIQEDASSCGAVSIQSIIAHYGGYIPLPKVQEDTSQDKSGTNALELVRAMRTYGFNARGKKLEIGDLGNVVLPCIAHVSREGYEHFLVIYEITEKAFVTMDPAYGKKVYPFREFDEMFTGHIIEAIKEGDIPHYKKSNSLGKLLWATIRGERGMIIETFLLNGAIILLSILLSFHLKILSVIPNTLILTAFFVIIRSITFLLINRRSTHLERLAKRLEDKTAGTFLDHVFRLPSSVLSRKRVGELTRKVEELSFVKDLLIRLTLLNTMDIFTIFVTFLIGLHISKEITGVYISVFLIVLILTPLFKRRIYKNTVDCIRLNDEYRGTLVEDLGALDSIKNLNGVEKFSKDLKDDLERYTKRRLKANRFLAISGEVKMFIYDTATLVVNLVGISMLSEQFTFYDLVALQGLFSLGYSSFESIVETFTHLAKGKASLKALSELLDVEEEKVSSKHLKEFLGLDIVGLSYSYDSIRENVHDFSLKIERGDKILLSGQSGIGKSTLVKCLSGRFTDYKGKILLNGLDIRGLGINVLRDHVVYVGQEERLFRRSIEENITLGDMDEEWLERVLKITKVDEVIASRRDGKNTSLLEGASNLSGGERARIILARALYKKPSLLIIDETLSSVGIKMEDEIIANLKSLDDVAIVYITHRDKQKLFPIIITLRKEGKYVIKRK